VSTGDPEDAFLTVAEVAATLKLNQQTVRNWIDQGSLPALRVGRRVRIRRSDFQRLLDQGYMSGGGAARPDPGPSAEDFWSGEPVGVPDTPPPEDIRPRV
jgi:excisionase family DNA binding protein